MAQEQPMQSSGNGVTAPSVQAAPATAVESSGVEILIARLRDDGIAQGQRQAAALVAAAQQQAADIVANAKRDTEAIVAKANEEAGKLKAAGEDAIRLAMRDTMLSLEGDLINRFQNMLRGLVRGILDDQEFLKRLILAVAGTAAPAASAEGVELLLPAKVVSLEELQRKPEEAAAGTLAHFLLSVGGGMLREGVRFGVADDLASGIRVQLTGESMQVDVTESTVTQLLLQHMLPRFRALLRGAVSVDGGDAKPSPATALDRTAA